MYLQNASKIIILEVMRNTFSIMTYSDCRFISCAISNSLCQPVLNFELNFVIFNKNMEIVNYILYILAAAIIIYVMNRYFSGSKYNGLKPNLWGSVAVITGGNAGIGRETALTLA